MGIRERVLGLEHPDTLGSRNNLANGYRSFGCYDEAVLISEETLRIYERVMGRKIPTHWQVASV